MPKHNSFIKEYSKQYDALQAEREEFREKERLFQFEDWRENPEPNAQVWYIETNIYKRCAWLGSPLFTDHYPDNVYLTKEDAERGLSLLKSRMHDVMKMIHGKYQQLELPFLEKIK